MQQLYFRAQEGEGLVLTRQSKGCCSLSQAKHSVARENAHSIKVAEGGGVWGQPGWAAVRMPAAVKRMHWRGQRKAGWAAYMVGLHRCSATPSREIRCQKTQAEMPKGLHIFLPSCVNSCLSPLELCFTHTHYLRAKPTKSGFLQVCFSPLYSLMLMKAWTHTTFPPHSCIFPLPHHLLWSKSHEPNSSGTLLPPSNLVAIGLQFKGCFRGLHIDSSRLANTQLHNLCFLRGWNKKNNKRWKQKAQLLCPQLHSNPASVQQQSWRIKASMLQKHSWVL